MSSGVVRELQLVQNLIDLCLQCYMNKEEVVWTLLVEANIEPAITEIVWHNLEEENQEFFRAYYLRLMLKHQTICFNKLLEKQVELMLKIHSAGAATLPIFDGSRTLPLQQTPPCYAMEHTITPGSDDMHHAMRPPNAAVNGGPSMHQSLHLSDHISHSGTMNLYPDIFLGQKMSTDMLRGMNKTAINWKPSRSDCPVFAIGDDGNVLHSRPTVGEASAASSNSAELISQPLTESHPDADIGYLGHIPRNFGHSE